ncbi:DUF1566 domain-containing protein [Pseudoalteromonas sp. CO348]|uniref:Lcl domain-containing protein n=1 Tax=Pseudoalteromonas TaxID=53246 RepID=UPI0010238477|nr:MULTISPECIES: DUF1566 domain-containing protein [Pseudoalteromonas]MCG7538335.1 DUF1566 domain-containing protein [Pseudoalteromonas sp. OF7H-1]MCG9769731.1 DUF1566 domain-containing protein [Pseudoalteromonas piscicida]QZO11927.1 DUF1566 domain-containing protein [Pseudoalteromonas piscicida]RZG08326.1 DUF1566 domain-containing protein [Pseudoalteromonas sp. CO348]
MNKLMITLLTLVCSNVFANCDISPAARFQSDSQQVVHDLKHRLSWVNCVVGLSLNECVTPTLNRINVSGFSAIETAAATSIAGYDDWRLPNVKELHALFEDECTASQRNSVFVFPSNLNRVWSGTTGASGASAGLLLLNVDNLQIQSWDLESAGAAVMLVRDMNSQGIKE